MQQGACQGSATLCRPCNACRPLHQASADRPGPEPCAGQQTAACGSHPPRDVMQPAAASCYTQPQDVGWVHTCCRIVITGGSWASAASHSGLPSFAETLLLLRMQAFDIHR